MELVQRKIECGYLFFNCSECGRIWKEKSRDCFSLSGSNCDRCDSFVQMVDREKHPEWETDLHGNLVYPNLYVGQEEVGDTYLALARELLSLLERSCDETYELSYLSTQIKISEFLMHRLDNNPKLPVKNV